MIRVLFLTLLLIYYWYFYAFCYTSVTKPSTKLPTETPVYKFQFESDSPNHFRFVVNGNSVWEHVLPKDSFTFLQGKIMKTDPCHNTVDNALVLAKGQVLYDHLKINPSISNLSSFKKNGQFTLQSGDVFYFKCLNGHIESLQICPSGSIFVTNVCKPINLCINKPNGTTIPHSHHASKYIVCENGNEIVLSCPPEHIFHHDRCESVKDLNHYCEHFENKPFMYDQHTRVECRNKQLIFITCKPGYAFLGKDYCEPANCVGLQNGTKLKLANRHYDPFYFSPGYMTCMNEKIDQTTECPQTWDSFYSKGDDLTFLPMVFDGNKCSIPTFGGNVFSDDPDVIVPVHEFTKHVKNWGQSALFDSLTGYVYENNVRKRKHLKVGLAITKRFKADCICSPELKKVPIPDNPKAYYDCDINTTVQCQANQIFNGTECVDRVEHSFSYNGIPLFHFSNLNHESWIAPFEYSKEAPQVCQDPESSFIELYNVCSHPDCINYAFVTQIPNYAVLLPREHQSKCKFYKDEKKLKKEPIKFKYHFWTQRITDEEEEPPCVRAHLKTGNFIWDSTISATCNLNQPFVFCPSKHTQNMLSAAEFIACGPPESTDFTLEPVVSWMPFAMNEIKRVKPANLDGKLKSIRLNKSKAFENLPDEGLEVPMGTRFNLFSNVKVKLEPRFRVTYPPNVVIQYDDDLVEHKCRVSTLNTGFLSKSNTFTHKSLTLLQHEPVNLAESLNKNLYV